MGAAQLCWGVLRGWALESVARADYKQNAGLDTGQMWLKGEPYSRQRPQYEQRCGDDSARGEGGAGMQGPHQVRELVEWSFFIGLAWAVGSLESLD